MSASKKEIKKALKKLTGRLENLFHVVEGASFEIEELELIIAKLRKDLTND